MKKTRFREIKSEIRLIGFDDGSFEPQTEGKAWLIGVVTRGGKGIDGILSSKIEVDGTDATSTIIDMINKSKHKDQIRIIMTSGITFAGFNIVDISKVFDKTGIPVIVISRKKPDLHSIKEALKNISNWQDRWNILNSTGEIYKVKSVGMEYRESEIYVQSIGIDMSDVREVIRKTTTRSSIPEPLRLAHLIATGVSRGESMGRA